MGNYEHVQVSAMVTVDALDLFTEEELAEMDPDDVMTALRAWCKKYLEQELEPELDDAAALSDAERSMLIEPPPKKSERRTERSKR